MTYDRRADANLGPLGAVVKAWFAEFTRELVGQLERKGYKVKVRQGPLDASVEAYPTRKVQAPKHRQITITIKRTLYSTISAHYGFEDNLERPTYESQDARLEEDAEPVPFLTKIVDDLT